MSGASETAAMLRTAVETPLASIGMAVAAARHAQAELRAADDLLPVLQSVVGVVLAMEALSEAADAAKAVARLALASAMSSTGCASVQTEHHTVSLRDAPRTARVIDLAQIPPEYMAQPPPKPDMAAIGKRLRDGGHVLGTVLGNQGEQTITIRARS